MIINQKLEKFAKTPAAMQHDMIFLGSITDHILMIYFTAKY
jgi:hypothetical protein